MAWKTLGENRQEPDISDIYLDGCPFFKDLALATGLCWVERPSDHPDGGNLSSAPAGTKFPTPVPFLPTFLIEDVRVC